MKRWGLAAKLLAFAGALVVAAAVAVPLVLKRYFPPEKVRELLVAQAQKSLHREVKLGDVSYGLLHGLSLHDLAVSETPDFSAGTFASMRSFSVRIQWLPLLSKKVLVDSVAVDGLKLNVVKRKDGSFNFSDVVSAGPAPANGGSPAQSPSGNALAVGNADVSGGEVSYKDLGTGDRVEVSRLSARVRNFRLSGNVGLDLSLAAKGEASGRPVDATLAYSGGIDLGGADPAKAAAEFKKLAATYGGLKLEASGKARGLTAPEGKLTFAVSGPHGALLSGSASGTLAPQSKGACGPNVNGEVDLATPGFSGEDLASLGVAKTLKVPALKLKGKGQYYCGKATFSSARVEGAWGTADLTGTVASFDPKKPVDDVDFEAALQLPALASKDFESYGVPAGLSLPASKLDAKGHLHNDDLRLDSFRLENARGSVKASGSAARLLSSQPSVQASVDLNLSLPEIRASEVPFAKLPPSFVSPAMKLDGTVKLAGDDVSLAPLHVKGKAGTIDVSGTVKKLRSGAPEPDLDVAAKLELPELSARDIPSDAVPSDFKLPPSQWDVAVAGSLDDVKIKKLRLKVGKNDVEIADARIKDLRGRAPAFSILVKCRSFVLDELKRLTKSTEELDIAGNGFFALEVTGRWPKPILAGKAQFREIAMNVSGLPLTAFTGTASFDERRIDVPNLKGKVADGDLDMNVTVKDYAKRPDIDLEASLTRFDLGKFLAAKTAVAQKKTEAQRQEAEAKHNAEPMDLKGRLTVGRLIHPNAEARDLKLTWELTGVTPDLKRLSGSATVGSSEGRFTNLEALGGQSKLVKVLISPLLALVKLGSLGVGFPDLNNLPYSEMAGDYRFQSGVMTVNDSHVYSKSANVTASGTIDLPREELDVTAQAQVGRLAPLPIACKGTLDKPNCKAQIGKFLATPAAQILQGIFKK